MKAVPARGARALVRAGGAVNTLGSGEVAIQGYDPVAYFTDGRAMKGSADFVYAWLGATWYFVNAGHRDAFAAAPISYAPQYGGFCTLSIADGSPAGINPQTWRIIDGKLYLFAGLPEEVKAGFDPDPAGVIGRADANWPGIRDRLEGE